MVIFGRYLKSAATLFLSSRGKSYEAARRVVGLPARIRLSADALALLKIAAMKILRVIGLGLLIIILQLLVPKVFHGAEEATVETFDMAAVVMSTARNALERGFPPPPRL